MASIQMCLIIANRICLKKFVFVPARRPVRNGTFFSTYANSKMDTVVIKTALGKVKGKIVDNTLGGKYCSFLGIPYAKPPIGNLRFKAPEPIEPWSTTLDATKEGPACPSAHLMFFNFIGREDNCLNLNVFVKEAPSSGSALKPVMVWIHGGAFLQGSNGLEFFGPDYFMPEDVVQVSVNYRLGVFGFLNFEDERLEVPGNAGLKDLVMALRWVKKYIASFGGDPNNVTIFGESAGGACTHYLVLSSLAKGLFQKAIMQSGCALNSWAHGEKGADDLAKRLGIKETDESKILEHLQRTCPKKLVQASMKPPETMCARKRVYGPVIEKPSPGAFITQEPIEIIKSGQYNKVPLIIGLNSNEGLLYYLLKRINFSKIHLDMEREIPHDLEIPPKSPKSAEIIEKITKYYGLNDNNISAENDLKSDHHFVHGIHRTILHHQKTSETPIFYYMFSFEGELNLFRRFAASKILPLFFLAHYFLGSSKKEVFRNVFHKFGDSLGFSKTIKGASHADDLGYLFRAVYTHTIDEKSKEMRTISRMTKMWTNFAKYGEPIPPKEHNIFGSEWRPVEKDRHYCINIGDELRLETEDPFRERNKFWDDIYKENSKY